MPNTKEFFGLVPPREEGQSVDQPERPSTWPLMQALAREDQPVTPRLSDSERDAAWSVPENVELPEVIEDEETRADLLAEGLLRTRMALRNAPPEPVPEVAADESLSSMQAMASTPSVRAPFTPASMAAPMSRPEPVSAPAPVASHPHNPFAKPAPAESAPATTVPPVRAATPAVAEHGIAPAMPSPPAAKPESTPSSLSALFRRISGGSAAPAVKSDVPSSPSPTAGAPTARGFLTRLGRK